MQNELLEMQERARQLKATGDTAGALRIRKQLEEGLSWCGAEPLVQANNLNQIAFLEMCARNLAGAERAARRCLEIYSPVAREVAERIATYKWMLAGVLAESQKFEEASRMAGEAIEIFAKNHGYDDGFVVDRRTDLEAMRNGQVREYIDVS